MVSFASRLWLRTVVGTLGTGSGALVTGVARNTHDCEFCCCRKQRSAKDVQCVSPLREWEGEDPETGYQRRQGNSFPERRMRRSDKCQYCNCLVVFVFQEQIGSRRRQFWTAN